MLRSSGLAALSAGRSASTLTGRLRVVRRTTTHRPALVSFLVSYIRIPAPIGVYDWPLSSQRDLRGRSCTVNRITESGWSQRCGGGAEAR